MNLFESIKQAHPNNQESVDILCKALIAAGHFPEVRPILMPQVKDLFLLDRRDGRGPLVYVVSSMELYQDDTEEMITITAKRQT